MAVNKRVTIAHLYPDEMNLYGDSGNVLCLYNRLIWRGYNVSINEISIGDKFTDDFDILFIGGGQDREMEIIKNDLRKKSDALKYFADSGKTILAICGGYQILGEYYETEKGAQIKLSGALPFYTKAGKQRLIGNSLYKTPFCTVAGFENHSGRTYLSKKLKPLGKVIRGYGNNARDKSEGVLYNNTFGTYAHGPVLPKNPALADELIKRALNLSEISSLDDSAENSCHNQLVSRFR